MESLTQYRLLLEKLDRLAETIGRVMRYVPRENSNVPSPCCRACSIAAVSSDCPSPDAPKSRT